VTAERSTVESLRRARALTAEMLDLAQEGDWESLPALEDERRHLIEKALAVPGSHTDTAQVRELVNRIIADSEAVIARVATQRDDLRQELSRLGRGRKATTAYRRGHG